MYPHRPEQRLWRWYRSLYPITQFVLGCLVLIVALFACSVCAIGAPSFMQGFQRGLKIGAVTQPTPVHTIGPRMGGPLSDFVNTYGTPTATGATSDMFTSDSVQITVSFDNSQVVTTISVTGPSSWTSSTTEEYCPQFLPDGATEYQSNSGDGNTYLDYHSSLGDVTLQLGTSTCVLFVAPS